MCTAARAVKCIRLLRVDSGPCSRLCQAIARHDALHADISWRENADSYIAERAHAGLEKVDRVNGENRFPACFCLRFPMLYGAADVEKDDLVELCEPVRAGKYQRRKLRPVQTAVREKNLAERGCKRRFEVRVGFQELVIKRVAVDDFAAARGNFLQKRRLAAARWGR